jgi:riboflavin kinase/FMN adenylyltransferase
MRLFRHFAHLPADVQGAAVAIGNFDGVHLGHREVIGAAGRTARAGGLPWAVLTLEPHPRALFHPEEPPFRLTPAPVKARLIEALGPEVMVIVPFDLDFSRLSARAFVDRVLVRGLRARHVVCGHDFAFGHARKGTPELLLWLGDEFDFGFTCVQEVRDGNGEPYSSTRIRDLLRGGDPPGAARLLGRPFEIEGVIAEGDRRGRTIGFPTANLRLGDYVRPAKGVYAVRAAIDDGGDAFWHDGVANIGRRPTFGGGEMLLEAHLFDFADAIYGRTLRVQLLDYLRPEQRFDGIEALKAQIHEDCMLARRRLADAAGGTRLAAAGHG